MKPALPIADNFGRIHIAPQDDVVLDTFLECGKPDFRRRIRVSSKVVSEASDVFNELIAANHVEELALERTTARGYLVAIDVTLPSEDDAVAMLMLFVFLHGLPKDSEIELEADELYSLAVVAHKYECIDAVRVAASRSLRHHAELGTKQAVAAAYMFGDGDVFLEATQQYIMRHGGAEHSIDDPSLNRGGLQRALSNGLRQAYSITRGAIAKTMLSLISGPDYHFVACNRHGFVAPTVVDPDTGVPMPGGPWYQYSLHDHALDAAFTRQIAQLGLQPGSPSSDATNLPKSILEYCENVASFKEPENVVGGTPERGPFSIARIEGDVDCKACRIGMVETCRTLVGKVKSEVKGLCLACVIGEPPCPNH